jgi:hypothetical protein
MASNEADEWNLPKVDKSSFCHPRSVVQKRVTTAVLISAKAFCYFEVNVNVRRGADV